MATLRRARTASCAAQVANCILCAAIADPAGASSPPPPPGLDPPATVFTWRPPIEATQGASYWDQLTVDPEGNAYVAHSRDNTVWKVSPDGQDLGHWVVVPPDGFDGMFRGIEATAGGELFVLSGDWEYVWMHRFTTDGTLVDSRLLDLYLEVGDVAIDHALNIYVTADIASDDIFVLDQFGNRLRTLSAPDFGNFYVDVDRDGQLWIADEDRQYLHRMSPDGEVLETIELEGAPGDTREFRVGPGGNFYVGGRADVTVFAPRGNCLTPLPGSGSPVEIAIGPQGEILALYSGREYWLSKLEALPAGVLFASDPPGRPVLVDGVIHDMPWFHAAPAGADLRVSVSPSETPPGGTRYDFTGWSDGSPESSRDVAIPPYSGFLGATFDATFVGGRYEVSISASDVDPYSNTAPASGVRNLYLWLTASEGGISAFEADVLAEGVLQVFGFNPLNGVLNVASAGNLMLAIPNCPQGASTSHLLGYWTVLDEGGGVCLQASARGGVRGAVDCRDAPELWGVHVRGFASVGEPCIVEPSSRPTHLTAPFERPDGLRPATALAPTALRAPRPNPFREESVVEFSLDSPRRATVAVYDVSGRLVRKVVDRPLPAGVHSAAWNGRDELGRRVASGTYFVRLEAGEDSRTRKIVFLNGE